MQPDAKQMQEFWRLVQQGYINQKNLLAYFKLCKKEAKDLQEKSVFSLKLDKGYMLEELLSLGGYDQVHQHLEEIIKQAKFGVSGLVHKYKLFENSDHVAPCNMVYAMRKAGLTQAGLADLLIFGAHFPLVQTKFNVVAMDKPITGNNHRLVPALIDEGKKRKLVLRSYALAYGTYDRILGKVEG